MIPGKSGSPDCSFAIRFVRSSSLTVRYRGRPRSTAERNAPTVIGVSRVTIGDSSMQDRGARGGGGDELRVNPIRNRLSASGGSRIAPDVYVRHRHEDSSLYYPL